MSQVIFLALLNNKISWREDCTNLCGPLFLDGFCKFALSLLSTQSVGIWTAPLYNSLFRGGINHLSTKKR